MRKIDHPWPSIQSTLLKVLVWGEDRLVHILRIRLTIGTCSNNTLHRTIIHLFRIMISTTRLGLPISWWLNSINSSRIHIRTEVFMFPSSKTSHHVRHQLCPTTKAVLKVAITIISWLRRSMTTVHQPLKRMFNLVLMVQINHQLIRTTPAVLPSAMIMRCFKLNTSRDMLRQIRDIIRL